MQPAGVIRRRQKLEPPPSDTGSTENAMDNNPNARHGSPRSNNKRRKPKPTKLKDSSSNNNCHANLSSSASFFRLTKRELTLVLATAILVYGWCCFTTQGSPSSGGDYAGFLSSFGDRVATTSTSSSGTGGGHPRDPPYLRDFSPLSGAGSRHGAFRGGGEDDTTENNKNNRKVFAPVPEAAMKTFFYDNQKISMPVIRALRSRGWKKVDEIEDAQMIYTYKQMEELGDDLEKWQRFNLIPNASLWNDKWSFAQRYKEWEGEQKRKLTQKQNKRPPRIVQRYKEWEAEQKRIRKLNKDDDENENEKNGGGGWDSDGDAPNVHSSVYVPESYMLTGASNTEERLAFARRLEGKNHGTSDKNNVNNDDQDNNNDDDDASTNIGADHPWVLKEGDVNQGRGITILAPNSPELMAVPYRFQREEEERQLRKEHRKEDNEGAQDEDTDDGASDVIVQKYVCNEMTWNNRKFDVRVFWLVASLDPLVVMYHDGYVRIGNADYSETDFSDTKKHLTTHTKLGAEGKATWNEFAQALEDSLSPSSPPNTSKVFPGGKGGFAIPATPIEHVRNQMKEALAEMIERFRDVSFVSNFQELPTENSYSFYCADFILDNDLDVWFLEPQVNSTASPRSLIVKW
jgi:hypothetical protein